MKSAKLLRKNARICQC